MKKVIKLTESSLINIITNVINEMTQDDFTRKFNVSDSKYGSGELVKIISSFSEGDISFKGIMGQNPDGSPWFMPIENGVKIDENIIKNDTTSGYGNHLKELIKNYNKWALEEKKLEITDSADFDREGSLSLNPEYWENGIMIPKLYPYVIGKGTKVVKI